MSEYKLEVFSGVERLRIEAEAWNDLWSRSYTAQPTVRAECIDLWCSTFSDPEDLIAFAVFDGELLVAALPLVPGDLRGFLRIHQLPTNCWANCGDLLLDRDADASGAIPVLWAGLRDSSVRLAMFDEIAVDSPQWQVLQTLLREGGQQFQITGRRPVGIIDILYDWERYQASWSSRYRTALKRSHKKLQAAGEVRVELHRNPSPDALPDLMRAAFDIEDRSWKGSNDSSILAAGMTEYMLAEAELMRDHGSLDLWMLLLDGAPIAFEYCHLAKGTCFSQKIGFDPQHRALGPGRLLKMFQLQQYHEDPGCRLLDTLGVFTESKAKWATRTYDVGRMYASFGDPLSNLLLQSYSAAQPLLEKFKSTEQGQELALGAARYLDSTDSTAC